MSKTKKIWIGVCTFVLLGGGITTYVLFENSQVSMSKQANKAVENKKTSKEKERKDPFQEITKKEGDPMKELTSGEGVQRALDSASSILAPLSKTATAKVLALADEAIAKVDAKREDKGNIGIQTVEKPIISLPDKKETAPIVSVPPQEKPPVRPEVVYPVNREEVVRLVATINERSIEVESQLDTYNQTVASEIVSIHGVESEIHDFNANLVSLNTTKRMVERQWDIVVSMDRTSEVLEEEKASFLSLYETYMAEEASLRSAVNLDKIEMEQAEIALGQLDYRNTIYASKYQVEEAENRLEEKLAELYTLQGKDTEGRYTTSLQQAKADAIALIERANQEMREGEITIETKLEEQEDAVQQASYELFVILRELDTEVTIVNEWKAIIEAITPTTEESEYPEVE
ncbi:hypothetical protein HB837_09680 [Listeria innocua]|uniref:hypothetical protein n=1 Tax=Listeria innocua TaxID=1642 RepID=UPI001626917D|nr:hypothetical protein [Listeria innocua]MBC1339583.1 hypothetical protein [Listeria innocua]MBC1352718.1 hypothetical protein [Listeria innocua]